MTDAAGSDNPEPEEAAESKVRKADVTKQKIVDAALELFAEKGYEQATMRAIAQRAGVSVGNAYYYFPSKEALMQGYYAGLLKQFAERIEPVLQGDKSFASRLTKILLAWVDNARPYQAFAGDFFRFAANPSSPLSPFSSESGPTRSASIDVHRQVVEGSRGLRMSDEVRERLPELLWLYQMGIVLYWVHDSSPEQQNTRNLVTRTAPMVARLVGMSRLPVLRSTAREIMDLVASLSSRNAEKS